MCIAFGFLLSRLSFPFFFFLDGNYQINLCSTIHVKLFLYLVTMNQSTIIDYLLVRLFVFYVHEASVHVPIA